MKNLTTYFSLTALMLAIGIGFNACNDPCNDIECNNGGTCVDGNCDCPENYSGKFCDTYIDPCNNVNCLNGGTCDNGTCDCPPGYTGANCQTENPAELCASYPCVNGTLTIITGNCYCDCDPGYTGSDCSQQIPVSPFVGSYNVQETCNTGNQSYSMSMATGSFSSQVTITNLFNAGATINGTVNGNNISIPSQQVYALGTTGSVFGSGIKNGNTVTIEYFITYSGGTIQCNAVCSKQ